MSEKMYTYNGKLISPSAGNVIGSLGAPPGPVLPAKTIRCKFTSGYTPTMGYSQTLVDASENIWDIYKSEANWDDLFFDARQLEEVIAANTTGVTHMNSMFEACTSLTSVPLLDTSSVKYMDYTFYGCYAVESGALALYQQASTQASPPTSHTATFGDCGRDTVTGAAELAQIPTSWGGTMAE